MNYKVSYNEKNYNSDEKEKGFKIYFFTENEEIIFYNFELIGKYNPYIYFTGINQCVIIIRENYDEKLIKDFIKNNYDKYIGEKDLYNEFYSLSQKKDFKFAFAESCTGGYLSSRFVFIPGVSSNYLGSMVVYNEKLKKNILGVKEETINTKTVYSNECVREMTLGLEKITNAQVLASVSGMAGDIYKKEKKEDGVVFFCFKIYDKILIEKKFFLYERKKFIETASNYIVFKLLKEINTLEEGTA